MGSRLTANKNLFVALHESKKIYHVVFWVAVLAFSFLLLIEFLKTKYYYSATDGLYYFSIAKNLYENGIFRDLVTNGLIFTPQNGAVFIQYILLKFGCRPEQIFVATTFINYTALLSAIFPLMAIMRFIGIRSRIAAYSIIAYCLCDWQFFSTMLFPQNEGLFVAGNIWLIYLLTRMHQYKYDEITSNKIQQRICLFSCIAISAIAMHFRLNIIFVPLAGITASLLLKKFKTIPFMIVLTLIMLISLIAPYCFVETDIIAYSQGKGFDIITNLKSTVLGFCFHTFPGSIFRDFTMRSNVIYLPVLFCLFAALITAIKRKEYLKLKVLFVCFMTFGLLIIYGIFNVRFLIIVTPLVFIIMLDSKHFRNIAYLFIFAAISTTLWSYYDGIKAPAFVDFWLHVSRTTKFEGEDPMVIAAKRRPCWFFTGISPEFPQKQWAHWTTQPPKYSGHADFTRWYIEFFTWEKLKGRKNIYLAGHEDFVEFQGNKIKQMAKENDFDTRFEIVTPLYRERMVSRVFIEPKKE